MELNFVKFSLTKITLLFHYTMIICMGQNIRNMPGICRLLVESGILRCSKDLPDQIENTNPYYIRCYPCRCFRRQYEALRLPYDFDDFEREIRAEENREKQLCAPTSIILTEKNIYKVLADAFECVTDIKELDLSNNKIKYMPGRSLSKLKKLKKLKINHNEIATLTKDTFEGLASLRELSLNSNLIQHLSDDVFYDMVSLQILYLQDNKLQSLSNYTLSNLTKLKNLSLGNNNLTRLFSIFYKNSELINLDLSSNYKLVLEKNSFLGLVKLKKLNVDHCGITSLPNDLFRDMSSLSELSITNNNLKEITVETFGALTTLTRLLLRYNAIAVLKDKPFTRTTNLRDIDLSRNNLTEIKESDFEGLSSLKKLDVSSNSIVKVARQSFVSTPQLETLIMKENKINGTFTLEKNTALKVIDISHNQFINFRDMGLLELPRLEEFRATNNKMQNLNLSLFISQNSSVQKPKIYLESNKIKRINLTFEYGKNFSLINSDVKFQIYLNGNPLECDCLMYDLYSRLKNNSLIFVEFVNGLTCQLPEDLKGKNLISLNHDAFTCSITDYCPVNCKCIYRASERSPIVYCNNRGYENLPSQAPPDTKILYIGQNTLTSLARLNDSVWENLTQIYAEDNKIEYEEFPIPKNLIFLGLRGNKIDALPDNIKKHAETAKDFTMTLSNKFWRCDCWLLHLKAFISEHRKSVNDINDLRCIFANNSISRYNLISMPDDELCPNIYHYAFKVGFVLLLLCILIFYKRYKLRLLSILNTDFPEFYRIFCCSKPIRDKKLFDCFISCGSEDREIKMAILKELERKPPRYSFCMHERNWTVGKNITNNLNHSIQYSRITLIILSKTFAKSEWFHLEFEEAFRQIQKNKKYKLIIVLVEDFPDENSLPANVQYFISSGIYLKFGEKKFWEKLRRAFCLENVLKLNVPTTEDA